MRALSPTLSTYKCWTLGPETQSCPQKQMNRKVERWSRKHRALDCMFHRTGQALKRDRTWEGFLSSPSLHHADMQRDIFLVQDTRWNFIFLEHIWYCICLKPHFKTCLYAIWLFFGSSYYVLSRISLKYVWINTNHGRKMEKERVISCFPFNLYVIMKMATLPVILPVPSTWICLSKFDK